MGLLIEGKWRTDWYETKSTGGRFVRKDRRSGQAQRGAAGSDSGSRRASSA